MIAHGMEDWISSFLHDHPEAELYLVGGAVRDNLLGRKTKDFDYVVRGMQKPELETWLAAHGQVDFVGTAFGVYKFIYAGTDTVIDIALPRTESALPDSRGGYREFEIEARMDLPIEMDLSRRDFTINAMARDERTQVIIDPYHGRRDLEAKVIRAVGVAEDRFKEDLTRILRAIRFSCSLSFHIEERTWRAMRALAHHLNDKNESGQWVIARDTIGREFIKSFLADPACTLVKYQDVGLTELLFPSIDTQRALERVGEVSALSPNLLVALLLSTTTPEDARTILSSYRFHQLPREHRLHIDDDTVLWLLRSAHVLDVIEDPKAMPGSMFEKLFLTDRGAELLDLMMITGTVKKEKLQSVRERVSALRAQFGTEIPELVSGEDLIAAGFTPGPEFRAMIDRVRDAQMAGLITNKTEALTFLHKSQES